VLRIVVMAPATSEATIGELLDAIENSARGLGEVRGTLLTAVMMFLVRLTVAVIARLRGGFAGRFARAS
jgi:hypothetical protein